MSWKNLLRAGLTGVALIAGFNCATELTTSDLSGAASGSTADGGAGGMPNTASGTEAMATGSGAGAAVGGGGSTAAAGGGDGGAGGDPPNAGGGGGAEGECGNAMVEGTEACDDGNNIHCDGCFDNCEAGEILLSIGDYNDITGVLEILGRNCVDLYGFQFNVTGVTLTGAIEGNPPSAAADNDWTVQTGGTTVLGFSFAAQAIPAMSGTSQVLTYLEMDPATVTLGTTQVCIQDDATLVLSDMGGNAIKGAATDCVILN